MRDTKFIVSRVVRLPNVNPTAPTLTECGMNERILLCLT